jgi:hypothetical protein
MRQIRFVHTLVGSRDSVVGIATGYGLDDGGIGVRVPAQEFSLLNVVQTGFGTHPASYPMGTPGVKRPGRVADHSPPTSAEVKEFGSIHPLLHTPSWRSAYLIS